MYWHQRFHLCAAVFALGAERFVTMGVWSTDNTTATDWNDYDNSDPIGDVRTARRTIAQAIGRPANVMAMGLIVHDALVNHPDVLERIMMGGRR